MSTFESMNEKYLKKAEDENVKCVKDFIIALGGALAMSVGMIISMNNVAKFGLSCGKRVAYKEIAKKCERLDEVNDLLK